MGNGSNRLQSIHANNPNLAPYTKLTDKRFAEFENELEYLKEWKEEVDAMPKKTPVENGRMVLQNN